MLLKLAWRNIKRNRRRSILTVVAILFATLLTLVMMAGAMGTWENNIRATIGMFSGYLQIQREGFIDNPTLGKSFEYPGSVELALKARPEITGYAPRILADGLISFRDNSSGAAVIGMDPSAERKVSRFNERTRVGRLPDGMHGAEIAVGHKLLKNLGARVGDTVVILAQGYDGVMGNQRYRICGSLKFGAEEFDAMTVVMNLDEAQELLAMQGRVNVVAASLRDLDDVETAGPSCFAALREAGIEDLRVLPWSVVMPELKQNFEFEKVQDWFFYGMLIIIVAFGILNTVLMSVTERFREFGVSLAIGMEPGRLVRLVFIETGMIAGLGIFLGMAIGIPINIWFASHPIILGGQLAGFIEEYGFIPLITTTTKVWIPRAVIVIMCTVSFLSCLYPAYRVSKLEPLKGIRHT
jgi:putative ABC transport system permease protein